MRHIWLHVCFGAGEVLLNVDGRRGPVCWDADTSLPRRQLRHQAQDAESRQTMEENPRQAVGLVSGGKTPAPTDSSIHKRSLTSVSSDSLCSCLRGSRTSHGALLINRFIL